MVDMDYAEKILDDIRQLEDKMQNLTETDDINDDYNNMLDGLYAQLHDILLDMFCAGDRVYNKHKDEEGTVLHVDDHDGIVWMVVSMDRTGLTLLTNCALLSLENI